MIVCEMVTVQGLLKMPDGSWEGKVQHIEWHGYCGPTVMTDKWHESARRQPHEDSKFWDLMKDWRDAKFALDKNGYCINKDGERLTA